jgi:hypothetical protein
MKQSRNVKYKLTNDRNYIMSCLTSNKKAWDRMGGQDVDPELFFPVQDKLKWLRCGKHGVFLGIDMGNGIWEMHAALLPSSAGQGKRVAIGAYAWAFRNLECSECRSTIPRSSLGVIKFAEKLGLKLIKEDLYTVTYSVTREDFMDRK